MKVFTIRHEQYQSSFHGLGGLSYKDVGTFASEESARAKMDEIKNNILSSPGMIVEEFSNSYGCLFGISYGHEMGSMSFVPGAYKCVELEVTE